MIWFILITLLLPNEQGIRVKAGAYKTKAECEKNLRTVAVQATIKDIQLRGYCTTAEELKKDDKENGITQ